MLPARSRFPVVSSNHPSPANPVTAVFHRYLFSELARLCDLTVVTPVSWTSRLQPQVPLTSLVAPYTPPAYPLHHPLLVNVPVVGRELNGKALARSVRLVLDRQALPFDAVIATFAYPDGAAAVELAAELGIPCVIKVGGTDIHSLEGGTHRFRRTASVLRAASAIVAVSKGLADRCVEMGVSPDRVHVVRNGVDGERFRVVPREHARACFGLDSKRPIVLYVGRFEPVKDLDTLLDAFEWLERPKLDRRAPPQLLLVGYGSERERMEKRIAASRLRNHIKLLKPVSHPTLMLWLNAANVLAVSSRNEGSPNVVREALACGTPVVATRVGDLEDWIDGAAGELVPPGDSAGMAGALARVLGGEYDRVALRSRVANASWVEAAASWLRILASVVPPSSALAGGEMDRVLAEARAERRTRTLMRT